MRTLFINDKIIKCPYIKRPHPLQLIFYHEILLNHSIRRVIILGDLFHSHYNDTWLAKEWGHPSDNLGGLLAVCDYISQQRTQQSKAPLIIKDLLIAMIKAHEIQGCLALKNAFNRVGLDHVILVKVATTAVVAQLFGCNKQQIINAISLAFVDGHSLRTYRHAPNTGSRKSWAAGDATSRGVFLALLAKKD